MELTQMSIRLQESDLQEIVKLTREAAAEAEIIDEHDPEICPYAKLDIDYKHDHFFIKILATAYYKVSEKVGTIFMGHKELIGDAELTKIEIDNLQIYYDDGIYEHSVNIDNDFEDIDKALSV